MGPRDRLTRREAEVLDAVGRRLTNPEIADELVVSLRTVESHVASLRRKLGVDSRAGLRAAALPAAGRTVAASADAFIGREAELVTVRAALGAHRWVTLTGTVGCGKSRLAREAVAGRQSLLLDLEVAGPDLAVALASALGAQTTSTDALAAAGLALDAGVEVLVLDNCDRRFEECVRLVRDLTRGTQRVTVLCTSRGPLGAAEEVVVPVAPLAGDADRSRAGVALFRQRARTAGAREDELDDSVLERICGRLDGLPLAIELAAARCRTVPAAELESLLTQGLGPLSSDSSPTGRHRTLAAAVDWSVQLLDDEARSALVALCALPGPVALGAVEGVLGVGSLPRVLDLVDRSLAWVNRDSRGVVQAGVLRTVREQVLTTAAADAVDVVRDAWCALIAGEAARLAAQARHDDGPATHLAWRSLADTLPWVIQRLSEQDATRAAAVARDIGVLSEQLGPDAATSAALAGVVARPDVAAAIPLTDLDLVGDALFFGHMDAAVHLSQLAAARRGVTPLERACVARLIGVLALNEGRAEDAIAALSEAEEFARAAGDGWRTAFALQGLAMAWDDNGHDEPRVWSLFEQAMQAYAEQGDAMHVNNVRYMMCHHAVSTGSRMDEALAWADLCVAYANDTSNIHELAHAWLVHAELTSTMGGLPVTDQENLLRAREVFASLGDARCLARALLALAGDARDPQRLDLLRGAWSAAVQSRKRQLIVRSARALAEALHANGANREAGLVLGGLAARFGTPAALAIAPNDPNVDWLTLIAEGAARARSKPGAP